MLFKYSYKDDHLRTTNPIYRYSRFILIKVNIIGLLLDQECKSLLLYEFQNLIKFVILRPEILKLVFLFRLDATNLL